jgi:hypothetical protein
MNTKRPQTTATSFVGAWKLESFTETLRDGSYVEPMGENPQGFLLYTEDGIVSAQLTGSERGEDGLSSKESSAIGRSQENTTSYIGYCGSFTVNSELQQVIHIPLVAHDRKLVGIPLYRKFLFESDRLTLKTSTVEAGEYIVEAQLVWRRHYPV